MQNSFRRESVWFLAHRQTIPMRTNPSCCEAIRRAIRSAKNWLESIRTATNCKELQRMGFIRIGSTDVKTVWNIRIGLTNRWEPWDFFGELTRSSTEQYDSGESAGDLIRIHIRSSSPSWFATVWLGHKTNCTTTVFLTGDSGSNCDSDLVQM